MKTIILWQFAALTAAFVIPDEQVSHLQHVEVQQHSRPAKFAILNEIEASLEDAADEFKNALNRVSDNLENLGHKSKHALDEALSYVQDTGDDVINMIDETNFDVQGWLDGVSEKEMDLEKYKLFGDRPCKGRHHHDDSDVDSAEEHDEPPHHDHPPHKDPEHDHPPHHGPKHGRGPHHKSNLTVYQLIASSKYTTKLAELINQYDDLVEALNGTKANYTVFAPTDRAFKKIPEHAPKPSKEQLLAVLSYHVSSDFYPAGRILNSRTIPTLLKSEHLGEEPLPQRLSTNIGFRGLTVNFYSRIVAVDIFGSNGVIHGVDSILIPPPKTLKIIDLLPSEFSTLELGLGKTGLYETLNTTAHAGGTFFAPSNFAFKKLGTKVNAFLFSSFGLKYLKALLEYHVVANQTLYSDAYYSAASAPDMFQPQEDGDHHHHHHGPTKGFFHVDLPTLLEDRSLSVDIARYGRLIEIKINGFSRVVVSDGIAEDGVLHVVGDVLIPPKQLPGGPGLAGETELTVEELMERLEPFVDGQAREEYWEDL